MRDVNGLRDVPRVAVNHGSVGRSGGSDKANERTRSRKDWPFQTSGIRAALVVHSDSAVLGGSRGDVNVAIASAATQRRSSGRAQSEVLPRCDDIDLGAKPTDISVMSIGLDFTTEFKNYAVGAPLP